jgi:hypothetical protein
MSSYFDTKTTFTSRPLHIKTITTNMNVNMNLNMNGNVNGNVNQFATLHQEWNLIEHLLQSQHWHPRYRPAYLFRRPDPGFDYGLVDRTIRAMRRAMAGIDGRWDVWGADRRDQIFARYHGDFVMVVNRLQTICTVCRNRYRGCAFCRGVLRQSIDWLQELSGDDEMRTDDSSEEFTDYHHRHRREDRRYRHGIRDLLHHLDHHGHHGDHHRHHRDHHGHHRRHDRHSDSSGSDDDDFRGRGARRRDGRRRDPDLDLHELNIRQANHLSEQANRRINDLEERVDRNNQRNRGENRGDGRFDRWTTFRDRINIIPILHDRFGALLGNGGVEAAEPPLALPANVDTTVDDLAGQGTEAMRIEDWQRAIDVYGRAVERLTTRINARMLDLNRIPLIARRVEYRAEHLAAMAKELNTPRATILTAVTRQVHDLQTYSGTLQLTPRVAKRVAESLAEALHAHDMDGTAVERLMELIQLHHIFNGVATSEINYQLGQIYGRQNHADTLRVLRDSIRQVGNDAGQRLKCSVAWAQEATTRTTPVRDINPILWTAWEARAGLPWDDTLIDCGLLLGKGYVDQGGRNDRAEAILRLTHEHARNNRQRTTASQSLILAIDTRAHSPDLEQHCRAVIAALADRAVDRARFEFILGRSLHATPNHAETRRLLQRAHNVMDRNAAAFPLDDRVECRVRLARAMLKARADPDAARAHLRAGWDARAQLGPRVAVLAAIQHARALAEGGRPAAERAQAGTVFARMWDEHADTALPPDLTADGFWVTLVAAAGYYVQYLHGLGTPEARVRMAQVGERARNIQRQLGLPPDRKLERYVGAGVGRGGVRGGAAPAFPVRQRRKQRDHWW